MVIGFKLGEAVASAKANGGTVVLLCKDPKLRASVESVATSDDVTCIDPSDLS